MVNGSRLFDGCTVFIVVDREIFMGLHMAENGSAYFFLKIEEALAEVRALCKSEAVVAIQRVLSPGVRANRSLYANGLAAYF